MLLTSRKMLQVGPEVNFINFDTILNEDADSIFLLQVLFL
jgi:hypothetical protein